VGRLDNYVGDVTRYVVDKAQCRVILTAPPAPDEASGNGDGSVGDAGGPGQPPR
jgi:hypothetical protein